MYAALYFPDFALQAALRHLPELRGQPVGLIPEKTARARLLQCTATAEQAGVERGMTPSQGQARCADLRVLIRSPEAERCARDAILEAAARFSPYLEDTAEGVCTLDLAHARDFHPEHLAESLLPQLARLRLEARLGFAPNADLALLAAQSTARWRAVRSGAELAELPLESLAFPAPMLAILRRWGIRSLGAFATLGQASLPARLGPEVLPLLAQAQGRVERPLRCLRVPETYEESVEFEHELETMEPLLFIIRRLLEQITLRLESAYLVAATLTLRLGFAHGGGEHERVFKIPAPTARLDVLFRAVETWLEHFTAERPINRLQLVATPVRPPRQQFSLFENALRDPNQFYETLARLVALLGHERVGMPVREETHRPDAFRLGELNLDHAAPVAAVYDRRHLSGLTVLGALAPGGHRPPLQHAPISHFLEDPSAIGLALRRFRPPLPAQVELNHESTPVALATTAVQGEALETLGPWHLSGDWWADAAWRRAEWDLYLSDGTLCRVCQEGERWFLEGVYD